MLKWLDSPTKPGEVYYIPDPTHIAVYRESNPDTNNRWCLVSEMLGLRSLPLQATEADEAKREAEGIIAEHADRLQERLNTLFRMLGPAEELEGAASGA